MSTQLESTELKNSSSSPAGVPPINKPADGKKAKPKKPVFVKISFLIEAHTELAFRLAALQLEIAGEPVHKHNEMGREMIKRYLDWLSRAKKIDLSPLPQQGALESGSGK